MAWCDTKLTALLVLLYTPEYADFLIENSKYIHCSHYPKINIILYEKLLSHSHTTKQNNMQNHRFPGHGFNVYTIVGKNIDILIDPVYNVYGILHPQKLFFSHLHNQIGQPDRQIVYSMQYDKHTPLEIKRSEVDPEYCLDLAPEREEYSQSCFAWRESCVEYTVIDRQIQTRFMKNYNHLHNYA